MNEKDLERSAYFLIIAYYLFEGTLPRFAWRDRGKSPKTPFTIFGNPTEISDHCPEYKSSVAGTPACRLLLTYLAYKPQLPSFAGSYQVCPPTRANKVFPSTGYQPTAAVAASSL
jgi:hypothetical protein